MGRAAGALGGLFTATQARRRDWVTLEVSLIQRTEEQTGKISISQQTKIIKKKKEKKKKGIKTCFQNKLKFHTVSKRSPKN